MDIEKVKINYYFAVDLLKETIAEMIIDFDDEGIKLIQNDDDCYNLLIEIEPNDFRRLTHLRVYYGELEARCVGIDHWIPLDAFHDWGYLIDEVISNLDVIYEL